MQNKEIEKAIPWNPWHGCKKVSVGCKNCFVYKMDQRYGKDASIITKGKTTYELKDKDCPPHSLVKLCFHLIFLLKKRMHGEQIVGILFEEEKIVSLL